MPDWISQANIDHFRKLLETETNPEKRAVIEREFDRGGSEVGCLGPTAGEERGLTALRHSFQWVG
jgi:hypothetical protein